MKSKLNVELLTRDVVIREVPSFKSVDGRLVFLDVGNYCFDIQRCDGKDKFLENVRCETYIGEIRFSRKLFDDSESFMSCTSDMIKVSVVKAYCFVARARGCGIVFVEQKWGIFDVYQRGAKIAVARMSGSNILVTTPEGEMMMSFSSGELVGMAYELKCKIVAEMVSRWDEM